MFNTSISIRFISSISYISKLLLDLSFSPVLFSSVQTSSSAEISSQLQQKQQHLLQLKQQQKQESTTATTTTSLPFFSNSQQNMPVLEKLNSLSKTSSSHSQGKSFQAHFTVQPMCFEGTKGEGGRGASDKNYLQQFLPPVDYLLFI